MQGRLVTDLTEQLGKSCSNGKEKTVDWDGTDSFNRSVRSGTYLVRIKAENVEKVSKVILLR